MKSDWLDELLPQQSNQIVCTYTMLSPTTYTPDNWIFLNIIQALLS